MTLLSDLVKRFLKANQLPLLGYGVLSALGLLVTLGIPTFIERFFSEVLLKPGGAQGSSLSYTIFGLMTCWALGEFAYFLQALIDRNFIPAMRQYVSTELVAKIIERFGRRHADLDTSGIIARLVKLPFVLGDLVNTMRSTVLHSIYVMLGVTVYMFYTLGMPAGIATLSFSVLAAAAIAGGFFSSLNSSTELDTAYDMSYAHYADVFDNIVSVFAFNGNEKETEEAAANHERVMRALKTTFWRITFARSLSIVLIGAYVIAMLYILYKRVQTGNTKGVGAAAMVSLFLTGQFNSFLSHLWPLTYDTSVLRRLDLFMTEMVDNAPDASVQCTPLVEGGGYVLSPDLTYKYDDANSPQFSVNERSITLNKDTVYHLKGGIGAGKSTFLHILAGQIRVGPGHAMLAGCDLASMSAEQVSGMVLYVPQLPKLFNRTVADNIWYPGVADANRLPELEEKMKQLQLDVTLDTVIKSNGDNVSGGQRQLIFLLRAWMARGRATFKAVLLDEPFSAIGTDQDGGQKTALIDLIMALAQNRVMVVVSHTELDRRLLADTSNRVESGKWSN